MPRLPMDYSKTIIYHFVCNDKSITDTYVGHTTNFIKRKNSHKNSCYNENGRDYNIKIYQNIRTNGNWENWKMTPLEEFSCENKIQACIKEQEWIDKLQSKMNSQKAFQSRENLLEQKREYTKNYRIENADKIKEYIINNVDKKSEYDKQNYIKNADELKKKFVCECGGKYTKQHKSIHIKTNKHLKFIG